MARNVRRTSFRSSVRRVTDWGFSLSAAAYVNIPAATAVLVSSIPGSVLGPLTPLTIVRTRGQLSVVPDQSQATEEQLGAMGITVISDRARAAGIGSIPRPGTETLWDGWFVHQFIAGKIFANTSVGFDSQGAIRYIIDSKAMRKIDGDESAIAFVVENQHSTHAFDFALQVRMLIKAG